MRPTRRQVVKSLFWLTLPAWLGPLCWWLSFTSWEVSSIAGWSVLSVAEGVFVLAGMYAVIVVIGGEDAHFLKERRKKEVFDVRIAGGVFLASFIVGVSLGQLVIRPWCVGKVLDRSAPLVAAIHDFERANGRPPNSLEELCPTYLPEVPMTGIGMDPEFSYFVGKPEDHDGNPWAIRVALPAHIPFFNWLVYYPTRMYPPHISGGLVTRADTWAEVFWIVD